jgi:hypothetical protein
MEHLRAQGWEPDIAERWIGGRFKVRKDLFGCWDLVALRPGEIAFVQVTSASNVSARLRKIAEHPKTELCRAAGATLLVHGWRKPTKTIRRWRLREENVS